MCSILSLKNQKEFDSVISNGYKRLGRYCILILAYYNPHYTDSSAYPSLQDGFCHDLASHNNTPNHHGNKPTIDNFLGIKVSRKFSKKACIRNKVKRRIRHIARNILCGKKSTNSISMVVIPKKGFEQIDFKKLQSDLFYNYKVAIRNLN